MPLLDTRRLQQAVLYLLSFALFAILAASSMYAQALPQITQAIDPDKVVALKGSVHPLVRNGAVDLGAVPDSTPTGRITLLLKRPAAQEQALQEFLTEVHRQGSPSYHKWLTPAEFGRNFGVDDSDMNAVKAWLQSQGLKIEKVNSAKSAVQFSGSAGQVGTAFGTSLHAYFVKGEVHHSNSSELKIPAALSPVIAAVGPMHDFHPRPLSHVLGTAQFTPKTHKFTPQFTLSVPQFNLGLAPEDLATQYNIGPLYSQGVTGKGQTIGIINDSNIDLSPVAAYRQLFNLDADPTKPNLPQVVIDGNDPGVNGDALEAYLDVEVSGAIAPEANIRLYTAAANDYSDGLSLAVIRAVEDDAASVLSLSFGGCEAFNAPFGNAFYNSAWEQAAAQGQTVMVSSGDSDSAGCDFAGSRFAEFGKQVNGLASTPWNVAVGGTDFYYPGGLNSVFNFWSQTNDGKNGSLLQPLPEQPWNNSIYGRNLFFGSAVIGGGGGPSGCAIPGSGKDPLTGIVVTLGDGSSFTFDCAQFTGYPKPSWQSGPGVPADGVRDLPDISLFASSGVNGSAYVTCEFAGDCIGNNLSGSQIQVTEIGGTSASAPAFAGMMALVNQRFGPQGQANTVLYPLARQFPSVFHDITVGSNNAPCSPTTQLSIECVADATGGTFSIGGWNATPGYDLASGLGSVDANQMVLNWDRVSFEGTRTNLRASATTVRHGQPVTLNFKVTSDAAGSKPSGNVSLMSDLPQYASKGLGIITLNSAGDASTTTNALPGGDYSLTAHYGGDAEFRASDSAPLSLTIRPEPSVIQPSTHAFKLSYSNGGFVPVLTDLGPLANGANYPYGTVFFVDLKITGESGSATTPATGSTTLLDFGKPLSTNSIDGTGASSYQNIALPAGQHSVRYSYSGDSSYLPTERSSQAGPLQFTVSKAQSIITSPQTLSVTSTIGQSFPYEVRVSGVGGGAPPTGTITFTAGNLPPQVVNLAPQIGGPFEQGSGVSYATAFYTNLPAGSYTFHASYSGDINWSASEFTGLTLTVAGTSSLLPSFTTVTLNSSSGSAPIDPTTVLTLNVTVSGGSRGTVAPTGLVVLVDELTPVALGFLKPALSGDTSSLTVTFRGGSLFGGTNQLAVLYLGDSNYQTSSSPLVNYTENGNDFTLATTTQTLALRSGQSGVGLLQLQGLRQFSGDVNLSCKVTGGPTGNSVLPTCAVPSLVRVQSNSSSTATVNIETGRNGDGEERDDSPSSSVRPGTYIAVVTGTTGAATHNVVMTIVVQGRDRDGHSR